MSKKRLDDRIKEGMRIRGNWSRESHKISNDLSPLIDVTVNGVGLKLHERIKDLSNFMYQASRATGKQKEQQELAIKGEMCEIGEMVFNAVNERFTTRVGGRRKKRTRRTRRGRRKKRTRRRKSRGKSRRRMRGKRKGKSRRKRKR